MASSESFQLPTLKQLIAHQSHSAFNIHGEKNRATQPLPLNSPRGFLKDDEEEDEVVDIPIQILDDQDEDPDKLLLLRVPQNKLNRTILHTVLKIRVIDPNSLGKDDGSELEDDTNLLTNELLIKEVRALSDQKIVKSQKQFEIVENEQPIELERSAATYRRPRIDSSFGQSSSVDQLIPDSMGSMTVIQNTEESLPANPRAADIERARRRRVRPNFTRGTAEPTHNNFRRKSIRRRNKVEVPDTTTTIRITTSRGSTLPDSTTPDFPRGFFLTRSTDETLVTQMDNETFVAIQSTESNNISSTEEISSSIGKLSSSDETTTSRSDETIFTTTLETNSEITDSLLMEDKDREFKFFANSEVTDSNKDQKDEFNFFATTSEISQKSEDNLEERFLDDYSSPTKTTSEDFDLKMTTFDDVINVTPSTVAEKVTAPRRHLRKKIKKIKLVSKEPLDLEDFTSPSNEEKGIRLKKINMKFTTDNPDSSINPEFISTNLEFTSTYPEFASTPNLYSINPDSTATKIESIDENSSTNSNYESLIINSDATTFPTIIVPATFEISDPASSVTTLATTNSISESVLPTSDPPSTDSPAPESFTDKDTNFKSEITVTDFDITEDTLLKTETIKSSTNHEFGSDSSTTNVFLDMKMDTDELVKQNMELENIGKNEVTTEKEFETTQFLNIETTPFTYSRMDQNETSDIVTSTRNESVLLEANYTSPLIDNQQQSTDESLKKKTIEETILKDSKPILNGRRRVLKRKRLGQKLEEKHSKVKTEAIETTLKRSEDKPIASSTISPVNAPVTEKLTRKRIIIYRGAKRFSTITTPSTTTVQSFSVTGDHQNQIVPRRRMRKVVRKRTKLPADDTSESVLSTEVESNRKGKKLSLSPEKKLVEDAEEAGSEVNTYRSSPETPRRPGSFYREPNRIRERTTTHQPPSSIHPTLRRFISPRRQSLHFEETTLPSKLKFASVDDAAVLLEHLARLEDQKAEMDDQANRAHEILLDNPETTTESGDPSIGTTFWRKISTTELPKILATTAIPALRRRQGQKYFNKIVAQNLTQRPRRPAIIDYDYYEDEELRFVGKPRLNGKLYVTSRGNINCLDQGNFPHPTSCKKFITCARMVNGLVVGTEYTCPDKLSFDPIGGICNWSAGLGCKE